MDINKNIENTKNIERVRRYHEQTKHRLDGYAKGPETLDWSMQPNPFRHYDGSEKIPLPLTANSFQAGFCDLYTTGKITSCEFNLTSIGALLELSMGLAAWKEYEGDRWSLRCNPSSGNLHPTEAYVIANDIDKLSGVYHYISYDHALEQRCVFNSYNDSTTEEQVVAQKDNTYLLLGLSSVLWREAWKYGERAYRYCQLDVGHAIAAIRYACAVLGWKAEIIPGVADDTIDRLLGLSREQDFGPAEREHADVLLKITASRSGADPNSDESGIESLLNASQDIKCTWFGKANVLDRRHLYDWPIIDEVAQAARTIGSSSSTQQSTRKAPSPLPCKTALQAGEIIQRRRSAQLFDGVTAIEAEGFFRILDMLLPRANTLPWDVFPWQPRLHLVLFVHRVNGLDPGLYILLRNSQALSALKSALSEKMEWSRVECAPDHLDFYRLVKANAQKAAATLSCHQRIASDGAFSLGMLSEFDAALETGPWAYKQLYWEAGIIGQVLYLEAEAAGLQGTGIGCFFDDPVHEILGIKNTAFQSLYHFTVGGALNDSRLRTLMPYAHLDRE